MGVVSCFLVTSCVFFFKQKTAYEMRISDWSSDVCSSDLAIAPTYAAILTALYSKRPHNALLGLTATPGRSWSDIGEDRKLSDYFDGRKVTLEVKGYDDPVTFLIDQKYLARPIFRTLNSDAGLTLSENDVRSEEHTSELQSLMRNSYAVFCLKKKKNNIINRQIPL